MNLQDILESRPVPTHRYYFNGIDHQTAHDFNRSSGKVVLHPYTNGYFVIKYDKSGDPFHRLIHQLSSIFGNPQIVSLSAGNRKLQNY